MDIIIIIILFALLIKGFINTIKDVKQYRMEQKLESHIDNILDHYEK